jgi:hypothetical protein
MAKEPKKNQVQNIIENLLNSEIPELQSVAHELTSWTKELEKHSWKLQHVASELETLMSTQGGAEAPTESNIVELLRNLETTLTQLKKEEKQPVSTLSGPVETRQEPEVSVAQEPEALLPEEPEASIPEERPLVRGEVPLPEPAPTSDIRTEEVERVEQEEALEPGTFITPEGFVVRKRRR